MNGWTKKKQEEITVHEGCVKPDRSNEIDLKTLLETLKTQLNTPPALPIASDLFTKEKNFLGCKIIYGNY